MYAITIRQPWASLIMAGIKTIETRSRATNIRGRVLIHSALRWAEEDQLAADWYDMGRPFDRAKYPLGKILGSVELTNCLPAEDWVYGINPVDYEREAVLGDLSPGRFAWVLKDPQPWGKPYPCKGQQGFWDAGKFAEIVDLM